MNIYQANWLEVIRMERANEGNIFRKFVEILFNRKSMEGKLLTGQLVIADSLQVFDGMSTFKMFHRWKICIPSVIGLQGEYVI